MTTKKLTGLFTATAADETTLKNYEGAPTFNRSDEEGLIRVLCTGTFENTFYASANTLANEAVELARKFAQDDPQFLANAIRYARNEGYMRTVPITALVVLSAGKSEQAKRLFREIFNDIIRTPGDLQDFLTICRAGKLRGMGKTVTHAAQDWLTTKLSEYHVIKYGSEKQDMSLRDIFRLVRPNPTGLGAYVVKGELNHVQYLQLSAYESLKAAATTYRADPSDNVEGEMLDLVRAGRLPWEVATTQLPQTARSWKAMMYQMPIMALTRNLVNLNNHGLARDMEAVTHIEKTLTDPDRVAKSKMLPFQFYSAYKRLLQVGGTHPTVLAAVDRAIELSVASMPRLGGRVLIANDISGSMQSEVSEKSNMTCAEIAGIFAAAILKSAENPIVLSFNTQVIERSVHNRQAFTDIARIVSHGIGGTNLGAPITWAFNSQRVYDTAIFITDSESWANYVQNGVQSATIIWPHLTGQQAQSSIALDLIRSYRKKINPNLNIFFIQLLPYTHAVAPQSEPGMYYLYGWSDSVLKFMGQIANGGTSQVDYVRNLHQTIGDTKVA